MSRKAVLFDLDGTLLPMDQQQFVRIYFGELAKKFAPYGYPPKEFIDAIWAGIAAMSSGDGQRTNEQSFWACFTKIFGQQALAHEPVFEDFYKKEFDAASAATAPTAQARRVIDLLHGHGIQTVLATNPVFPAVATQRRMKWAGLSPDDFVLYTTFENSRYCKPSLDYYRDILQTLDLCAEDCLMVGNDMEEDMVAQKLGMQVFLLTDCLINPRQRAISDYPHGGFEELFEFLEKSFL